MRFQNKTIVVTGAAQGIGQSIARKLAQQGARLALIDIQEKKLHSFVSEIEEKGGQAVPFVLDVSISSMVNDAIKRIERELGEIESLINVAGMLRTGLIESSSDEDWSAMFAVNATGVFNVSRAVISYMISRRSGSIVTVGSNAAKVPRMYMSAYAASKAAATHFTKCLGLEVAAYGIRCNVVSPGSTDTSMQRSLWSTEEDSKKVIAGSPELFKTGIPLKRIADPADIADVVLFFISEDARHLTMQEICVDGGATLGI